jgi:hypothetical protein
MNGSGNGVATEEVIAVAAESEPSSLDGFAGTSPADPFSEHPELLLAAGVLGGLMLAALVSRVGR